MISPRQVFEGVQFDFSSAKVMPRPITEFFELDGRHKWICKLIERYDEPHDKQTVWNLEVFCRVCGRELKKQKRTTYLEQML